MKIMAVDDEQKALNSFLRVLREVEPQADAVSFTEPKEAFAHLASNKVDIAFLDIKMGGLTGLELAKKCKSLCPTVNIIFVTGYSEYSMEALRLHVSGYLMKPVRADDLRAELENLRHPILQKPPCRVRIHTFGNFEIFVDDSPLPIPYAKAKECLAYLVNRKGAKVSYPELAAALWEDRAYDRSLQNYVHQAVFALISALKNAGMQDVIIKVNRQIAIDVTKIDCDYLSALNGDEDTRKSFTGEYMSQYSWAEGTLAELCRIM